MLDTAGATGAKIPPRGADAAPSSEIKSTPIAADTAAVSESVGTLGVKCVSLLWYSITTLSGKEFLKAWWHVVVCHRILWMNGILHRDISPSNLMVYKNANGEWIGVLNDYDLSSTQQDGPNGNERTRTIPFMAIDLLKEQALKGKVEHLYRHDAESLIWVLAWVCLRYENGKLRRNRPFNGWLQADAKQCRMEKTVFLFVTRHDEDPSPSHQFNWKIAGRCLLQVGRFINERPTSPPDDEVFETWLNAHVPPSIRK